MLELRFKLQKESYFKNFRRKQKVKLHTCALEHAFVQKSTKSQKHTQNSKKTKKNISFLKSISTLKFLTIKFLRCNIYQVKQRQHKLCT